MDHDLIKRHAAPVPRYTSYPTANHFSGKVGVPDYVAWLGAIEPNTRLSLYLHVPFCEALCWYCACSTKAVRRYDPVQRYLGRLEKEIRTVAALVPRPVTVSHIHWGGGSPSILKAPDIARLAAALREAFPIEPTAENAVEIDPRHMSTEQVAAFVAAGVNRVSLGVQDFDERVQQAIGRLQSFEMTRDVIEQFRARGVPSVNIDLVYGLPHQTEESLARTIDQVITLAPDRIAAFGYAHLPNRAKNQRQIDGSALPGPAERLAQSNRLSRMLIDAGWRQIGLDHFARGGDTLATKELRRNFQGYTADSADALIGFGASSISQLPAGFAQNAVTPGDYERRIEEQGLATARGLKLTEDDRIRAFVIERLMCDFTFSAPAVLDRFGTSARPVVDEALALPAADRDGFLAVTADGFEVTPKGRPFVRTLCAKLDRYLVPEAGKHAMAV